ncbi:MAG: hypothetical protein RL375_2625 [Pseudomonadota bacterium]
MTTYLISFRVDDADAVEAGLRRQVLRPHRKDGARIRVGDTLKLYRHLRTSFAQQIAMVRVAEVMSLRLDLKSGQLIIDGRLADADELHDIALREGLADSWHLRHTLGTSCPSGEFEGYCARW